jgi:Holliday junction resolvase-like predicted endonuclease
MNNQQNSRYSPKNFIKGKIVELIFDQMLREAGEFTVLPFGYERTLPEVAQHAHEVKFQHVLENIRSAPDFVLISGDKTKVFMVEVKYRSSHTNGDLVRIAEGIHEHWTAIWLFLATQDGFFFDSCTNVISSGGQIAPLSPEWVPEKIQKQYLELLKEFIK